MNLAQEWERVGDLWMSEIIKLFICIHACPLPKSAQGILSWLDLYPMNSAASTLASAWWAWSNGSLSGSEAGLSFDVSVSGKTHSNVRVCTKKGPGSGNGLVPAEGWWTLGKCLHFSRSCDLFPGLYGTERESAVPGDNSQWLNSHQMPSIFQVLTHYFWHCSVN